MKRKITEGEVIQTFNDEGECIAQEFVAGDQVAWKDDDDELIDWDDNCKYQRFDMVQPQAMAVVLIGNISNGFGAVGPFTDLNEAVRWADEESCETMTMQSPYTEFGSAKIPATAQRGNTVNGGGAG